MSENLVEAVVSEIDKLRYPVKPGMTVCGRAGYDAFRRAGYDAFRRAGYDAFGQAGYDVCGAPDLTKSSPTPLCSYVIPDSDRGSIPYPKIRSQKSLAEQSDMSENLVEAVVSDIDILRYPVKPGMTVCGRAGYDVCD